MENMKSLADQIRHELVKGASNDKSGKTREVKPVARKIREKPPDPDIFKSIIAFDNTRNKSMVHIRFDEKTVKLMNQFKMATNVDVTKLVAFSVNYLFETQPALKQIIKHFIQNTDL